MSEIKVNTISPSSGSSVSLSTGTFVIGNTGSNANLIVSSGTGESLPSGNIRIFSTNGIVKTATSYQSSSGSVWGEYIGPVSNHGLGLLTNNQTRLWIDATGNVGIGSTTPKVKLDLGNMFINTSSPTGAEQTSHIRLYEVGETRYGLGISTLALNIAANQSGGTIRLHTNSQERVRLDGDGHLGVGTKNPLDTLHVEGEFGPTGFGVYGSDNLLYNGAFSPFDASGLSAGWTVSTFGNTVGSPNATWITINSGPRGAGETVVRCLDGGGIYQDAQVIPGGVYTLCAKVRVSSTGAAGDASIAVLTVGTSVDALSIVNQQFNTNLYDSGDSVGKFVYASRTFTAPTGTSPLTTVRVGVRSLGSTHLIHATDIGLYKGAIAREFTPITVKPETKHVTISGALTVGKYATPEGNTLLHLRRDNPSINLQNTDPNGGAGGSIVFGHDQDGGAGRTGPVAMIKSILQDGSASNRGGDLSFYTAKGASMGLRMLLTLEGKLIVGPQSGVASPTSLLVFGPQFSSSYPVNAVLMDTDNPAVGKGGGLAFAGKPSTSSDVNSTSGRASYAGIGGYKENATDANYAGYLSLQTRGSGAGELSERMRISSDGNVGIGTTGPVSTLQVNGLITTAGLTSSAILSCATAPTQGQHLINKTYADSLTRIGATISFSMVYETAYTAPQWHGCTKPASSRVISLPSGTWNGYAYYIPSSGSPITMTSFANATSTITMNPASPAVGSYFNVHITRTA
jgi:hypothetical protein